jgi:hypothetical protein
VNPSPRTARPSRLARLAVLLIALAFLAVPVSAVAAGPPAAATAPFGDAEAAVIAYPELIAAADSGVLNAAVVDIDEGWVAASDQEGRVVAAEIPQPREGRDFGATTESAPAAEGLPSAFELTEALREDGVTILTPAVAETTRSSPMMRFLLIPLHGDPQPQRRRALRALRRERPRQDAKERPGGAPRDPVPRRRRL